MKYHPDVDPSPGAADKLQEIVKAYAVLTGQDKALDEATLLQNAVENYRSELKKRRKTLENLKKEAEEEEERLKAVEKRMAQADAKREEAVMKKDGENRELGALGGAA